LAGVEDVAPNAGVPLVLLGPLPNWKGVLVPVGGAEDPPKLNEPPGAALGAAAS
jgi:hypothetical protein